MAVSSLGENARGDVVKSKTPSKNKILKAVFETDEPEHAAKIAREDQVLAASLLTLLLVDLRKKLKLKALHAKHKSS